MVIHTSSGMLENIIGDCNTGGNVLSNFAVIFSFGTVEQKEKRASHVYVGKSLLLINWFNECPVQVIQCSQTSILKDRDGYRFCKMFHIFCVNCYQNC